MEPFDTEPESFENDVQSGVNRKPSHLKTNRFNGNSENGVIRKRYNNNNRLGAKLFLLSLRKKQQNGYLKCSNITISVADCYKYSAEYKSYCCGFTGAT